MTAPPTRLEGEEEIRFVGINERTLGGPAGEILGWLETQDARTTGALIGVGYDGRRGSDRLAKLMAEEMAAHGLQVLLGDGIVPTPALALAVRKDALWAGVMFTGGSAAADVLGIKIIDRSGSVIKVSHPQSPHPPASSGPDPRRLSTPPAIISSTGFLRDYTSYLRNILDLDTLRSFASDPINNPLVMIDSMGGTGQTIIEEILKECGWRAQTLFGVPEPGFFDRVPNPVPENLAPLEYNVSVVDPLVGIAISGDGSLCGAVLPGGAFVDHRTIEMSLARYVADRPGPLHKGPGGSAGVEAGPGSPIPSFPLSIQDGLISGLLLVETAARTRLPLRKILSV
ncbi:MAG TPA: hypothetical protein VMG34_00205 [Bacteroidota bacterium]|nr:hypothetical protein [Bacteroidota bacterium]